MWIPDGQGVMHYVDLLDDSEPEPTQRFDPDQDIVYLLFTRWDRYKFAIGAPVPWECATNTSWIHIVIGDMCSKIVLPTILSKRFSGPT